MGGQESKSAPKDDTTASKRRKMDLYRESASFDASTYARSSGYSPRSSLSSTPTPVPSSPPPVPSSSSTPSPPLLPSSRPLLPSTHSPPSVRLADDVRKDPPAKENCSSLEGATALGSGTHTDTQHTVTAEKVLDQFRDQFIKEMEAKKVTEELLHKDIISRGDQQTITREVDPTLQNQILHRCLKEKCTLDALRSVCATIKAVKGNPKMVALGDLMMRRLEMETGATALGSGTHTDTQHTVTEAHREGPHTLEQPRGHAVTQAPPGPFDKLRGYYTSSPVVQNSFPLRTEEAAMGYVELHLIKHHKRVPRAKPDEERSSVNLWKDGVEEFPHQTVPLKYEDIFNFPPDGDGSRRGVLVEGVPGSGKTTLVKRMCRDWANGSFAQDSKAVIQVVLRSLPKRDELTIEDMVLTSVGDKKEAAEIAQYIRDCQGDGVVFILDGYDELPEEMRQSSIVRDILKGHLAPKASFLITSRPIAAQSLYPLVDRRIEVTGFGEEEVEKYVTDYFATSDAAVGKELISTLRSRSTIRNLCFVPLLLRMVCFMASFGKALPRTMHELFEGLVILTVNCNLEKANRKERANSLEDVKRLCPSFMKLAQLALEGLKHDTLVFSDVPFEVDEALSGLMNCIVAQNRFGGTTRTWHFLHLTLQEYFATYALSVAPEAEQMSFWSERLLFKYSESRNRLGRRDYILSVDRFQTMFLLYCSITGLGSKTGVQAMLVKAADAMFEPVIEYGSALSALCQAVGESGNRELACRIMSTCGSSINIQVVGNEPVGIPWCIEVYGQHTEELQLSIHNCITPTVADFFSQMKDLVTLTGLDLSLSRSYMPGHERDDLTHLKSIAQFLIRQRALKHLKLSFEVLLGHHTFREDEVSCFWNVLEHHSGSLESLRLSGAGCVVAAGLPDLKCLRKVTVKHMNPVPVLQSVGLCWKLQEVSVTDPKHCEPTTQDWFKVSSSVANAQHLRKMNLSLGKSDIKLLQSILPSLASSQSLQELAVTCDASDAGDVIAAHLPTLKNLRKLEAQYMNSVPILLSATSCGKLHEVVIQDPEHCTGEDVSNSLVLQSLEEAVGQNKSLSRLKIVGRRCKWTNVATAVLKGAAKSTSLTDLELVTPEDFTPSKDIVDEVRRANPKLELRLDDRQTAGSDEGINPADAREGETSAAGFTESIISELYQKAIKGRPTITLHVAKAMTIGPPRVGKTCFRHHLLGLQPPECNPSTPVMKTAETISLSFVRSSTDDRRWILLNANSGIRSLMEHLRKDAILPNKAASDEQAETLTFPTVVPSRISKATVTALPDHPVDNASPMPKSKADFIAPTASLVEFEHSSDNIQLLIQEMLKLLSVKDQDKVTLPDAHLLQFIDCGGQLAYHDIIPTFVNIPAIYLHVFNLTMELTERPEDCVCNEGGSDGFSAKSPLTIAEMMDRSLLVIEDLACKKVQLPREVEAKGNPQPSVAFVGTHYDTFCAEYGDRTKAKLDEISRELNKSVRNRNVKVMQHRNPKLPPMFFPVNNYAEKTTGDDDRSSLSTSWLKNAIEEEVSAVKVKVPVKWYLYQFMQWGMNEKKQQTYGELCESCASVGLTDKGDIYAMVTYFHSLGLLLHHCRDESTKHIEDAEGCRCRVFTDPSYLFENITKLYQVQFWREEDVHGCLRDLKKYGKLTKDALTDLEIDKYLHECVMDILVHLFIGADIESSDSFRSLFIPSVLTNSVDITGLLETGTTPHSVRFAIAFIHGNDTSGDSSFIPCGVFTGMIARLQSTNDWNYCRESISRLHVEFQVLKNTVKLFDHATHIGIVLKSEKEAVGEVVEDFVQYCDTIIEATANSYCFLFHSNVTEHPLSKPCGDCTARPYLILGRTCPKYTAPEDLHFLKVQKDRGTLFVRCQTDGQSDLDDKECIPFHQRNFHCAVVKTQCTIDPAQAEKESGNNPPSVPGASGDARGQVCIAPPTTTGPHSVEHPTGDMRYDGSGPSMPAGDSTPAKRRKDVRGLATMNPWNKEALKSMRKELGRVKMDVVMIKQLEKSYVPNPENLGFLSEVQLQEVESEKTPAGQMNKVIDYLLEMEDKYFEDICTFLEKNNFKGKAQMLREKAEDLKKRSVVSAEESKRSDTSYPKKSARTYPKNTTTTYAKRSATTKANRSAATKARGSSQRASSEGTSQYTDGSGPSMPANHSTPARRREEGSGLDGSGPSMPAGDSTPARRREDVRGLATNLTVHDIEEHREEFLKKMNAKEIASKLQVRGLIPESVEHDIKHSKCREDANGCLWTFLLTDASETQVQKTFMFVSEETAYGRMSQFATKLLQQLQPVSAEESKRSATTYPKRSARTYPKTSYTTYTKRSATTKANISAATKAKRSTTARGSRQPASSEGTSQYTAYGGSSQGGIIVGHGGTGSRHYVTDGDDTDDEAYTSAEGQEDDGVHTPSPSQSRPLGRWRERSRPQYGSHPHSHIPIRQRKGTPSHIPIQHGTRPSSRILIHRGTRPCSRIPIRDGTRAPIQPSPDYLTSPVHLTGPLALPSRGSVTQSRTTPSRY